jgi:hypothetical protein
MDKVLNIKKEKDKKRNRGLKDGREQFRVVISAEANVALEAVLGTVADGFDAGAITKSDIANFVFMNLQKYLLDSDIKTLRGIHFDEKKVLSSLLKNESELPQDLKNAIRAHYGLMDKEKKLKP